MSPDRGRPRLSDAKKKVVRFEVRLTKEKADQLQKCSERLNISRAEVIERGIDMVDEQTKK